MPAAELQLGLPLLAVTVRRSALRSAGLWVQWEALSQRHRRLLITHTIITGITAITITNTTRATTGENIIVLTVDKRWGAPRRLRQTRPRGTERQASLPCGGQVGYRADARTALAGVLGIPARHYSYY